jgi:hypothetical protein
MHGVTMKRKKRKGFVVTDGVQLYIPGRIPWIHRREG